MIGICLALIKISKNWSMTKAVHTHRIVKMKIDSLIEKTKHNYYTPLSKKLLDPATSPKPYWSSLKRFLNNKKIPCIPPLLPENKIIINFRRKPEIFNTFFSKTMFSCKYLQWSSYNLYKENSWITVNNSLYEWWYSKNYRKPWPK